MLQNPSFTTSSKVPSSAREILRFLVRLALYVGLPGLVAVFLVERLTWRMGASMSPTEVAYLQHADPDIVWAGDNGYYGPFKLVRMQIEKPEIVYIGHSRCNQVRSAMFRPYKFYNACLTAWTLSQMYNMLDMITRRIHPRVVIIELDYFMFTDKYADRWNDKVAWDFTWNDNSRRVGPSRLVTFFKRWPLTMLYAAPLYLFSRARDSHDGLELLGVPAIVEKTGFRFDGSLLYDRINLGAAPVAVHNVATILSQVPPGDGAHIAPNQLAELRKIADLAKERQVTLVGLQLPIFKEAVNALDNGKDYRGFPASDMGVWQEFETEKTRELLRTMGIHFFDLSHDPDNSDPRGFIDQAHPSERTDLGALIQLTENREFMALFPTLDVEQMKRDYAKAKQEGHFLFLYHNRF